MAVVLFVYGLTVISLSMLTPERLTPLVRHFTEKSLQNCHVDLERVEIKLTSTYPFFMVDVRGMTITSTVMRDLPADTRATLPAWADTMMHFDRFEGGINVPALLTGDMKLSDVSLTGPTANLVVLADGTTTNYDIVKPTAEDEEPFDFMTLLPVDIQRLAVYSPGPIRYVDYSDGTEFAAHFGDMIIDGNGAPTYAVKFQGTVNTPALLDYMSIDNLRLGMGGNVHWDQSKPYVVGLSDFTVSADDLAATFDTQLDFTDQLRIDSLNVVLNPIDVNRIMALAPESMWAESGIDPAEVKTNMRINIAFRLLDPYTPATDFLPHSRLSLEIPDCRLHWRRMRFDNLALDMSLTIPDDRLDRIRVDLKRLNLRGPATDLTVSGNATNLIADPTFDVTIEGFSNLDQLPPQLTRLIPGSLQGRLRANAHIRGSQSMLQPGRFTRLHVDGSLGLDDLRWEGPDTLTMVYAHRTTFDFGTDRQYTDTAGRQSERTLAATLRVDSAMVLHDVMRMTVNDFAIGLGVTNKAYNPNSRQVIPMGGGLKIGSLRMLSLSDSARVLVRDIAGRAVIGTLDGDTRKPRFDLDLTLGRFMAGDRSTRVTLRDAATRFEMWPQPQGRRAQQITHIADSLRNSHPLLTADSIERLAIAMHAARHPRRNHRAVTELPDSSEIINFDTDNAFKRFITGWHIAGDLTAKRAGLFTPYFPLRNRITDVDMSVNNDSFAVRSLRYRGGTSDFTVRGSVSNIRRALTSRNGRQPLKINFDLTSDTIDINQLAGAAFAASEYAATSPDTRAAMNFGDTDSEDAMHSALAAQAAQAQAADTLTNGFLVPRNIDAHLTMQAKNVIYSDLLLHHFKGELLARNGVLNIHNLRAGSSELGSVQLSALYMGREPSDLSFSFGMKLYRFKIERFLKLMPAVDSIMPMMRNFSGTIRADIAATTRITRQMDFDLPSLDAALSITGDSLVLMDPETFQMLSKWLMFKNKERNVIDKMSVQMLVRDNEMELYPFIFNIDRYRLGVQGTNDFDLNFDYHISVLKSPLPFKFGINLRGNIDDYKIRLGGAKIKENTPVRVALVDNTRVNLITQIEDVFRRGADQSSFGTINRGMHRDLDRDRPKLDMTEDTVSQADSLQFIEQGLIDAPQPEPATANDRKRNKKRR